MIPLLYVVVLAWVMAGLGRRLLRWLSVTPCDSLETFVFSVGIGSGLLAYAVLGLGLAGLLYQPVMYGLVAAAALFVWPEWKGVSLVSTLRRALQPFLQTRLGVALALLLLFGVTLNFLGALAPISCSDALALHFGVPKIWLQHHRIGEILFDWESYHAMVVDLLFLLGMALHSDILGALIHWLFSVLIILEILSLCARHLPAANPLVAASIFYLSGLVAWEATSGFVDLGLTFYTVLAVHAFLNWKDRGTRSWVSVSGLCAGLAAATKYQGLIVPVLLGVLLLLPGMRPRQGLGVWRRLLDFVVPVVLLILPWWVKNFVQTGDPMYPIFSAFRGDPQAQAILSWVASVTNAGTSVFDLLALPFRLTFSGEAFGHSELIGPLYLSLLPFAAISLRQHLPLRVFWLFTLGFSLIWFLTCQQVRYLLPVLPLAAIACSLALERLVRVGLLVRGAATVALMAALSFGGAVTLVYNAALVPGAFGLEPKDTFLAKRAWFYDDIRWMNGHLPRDARVLFLARAGYYLDREYVKGGEAVAPNVDLTSPVLPDWLSHHGITHIFCTGDDCEQLESARWPLTLLREHEADLIRSRTLGGTRGRVRTAVFQCPRATVL